MDYYGQCIDNLDTDVNRNMFDVSRDLVKEVEEDRRLCKSDRDMVIGWIFERLENLNEPCRPTNSEENTCFHVRIYQVCRNRPIKILEYYDRPRPESPFRVNSAYYQLRRHNILTESEKKDTILSDSRFYNFQNDRIRIYEIL